MILSMVDVYFELVKAGRRKIESVPDLSGIRDSVITKLQEAKILE